jgi:hypothetical protein
MENRWFIEACRASDNAFDEPLMDAAAIVAYISPAPSAGWQSGYAEDCKSSYSGSIPLPASNFRPAARNGPFDGAPLGLGG